MWEINQTVISIIIYLRLRLVYILCVYLSIPFTEVDIICSGVAFCHTTTAWQQIFGILHLVPLTLPESHTAEQHCCVCRNVEKRPVGKKRPVSSAELVLDVDTKTQRVILKKKVVFYMKRNIR